MQTANKLQDYMSYPMWREEKSVNNDFLIAKLKQNHIIRNCCRMLNRFRAFIHSVVRNVKAKWTDPKEASAVLDTMYAEMNYTGRDRKRIIRDMIRMRREYGFDFDEYMLFQFYKLNDEQRLEFVSDKERKRICAIFNPKENRRIYDYKILTYFIYKKYYKREIIEFRGRKNNEKRFVEFYDKNTVFIVKPKAQSFGRGVQKVQAKAGNGHQVFAELCATYKKGFLVEELIQQCKELAAFHPQSLNTVRVPIIKYDDGCEVIHPSLKIGRGDSVVDNVGNGGIGCLIDVNTGCIVAASDGKGKCYTEHPESHLKLIGYKIPRFNEAIEFAKEIMTVIPNTRFLGLDLALTDDGWVMVEGNAQGQFGWQMHSQKGFKKELAQILKRMGIEDEKYVIKN